MLRPPHGLQGLAASAPPAARLPRPPLLGRAPSFEAPISSFGMVGLAVNGHGKALSGFLCSPWLRYLGKISYGLYIYHSMVFQTVHLTVSSLVSDPEAPLVKLMRATIGIALAVALASVSWYAVEQPLLRLKSAFVKGEAGRA